MRVVSLITVVIIISASSLLNAQAPTTKDTLTRFTNDYFKYYNRCHVDSLLDLCTDDIEVYHDMAGLINGKADFRIQSKKFCDWLATPDAPGMRAEVVGDLEIQELRTKSDDIYGAVITGTIDFIEISKQDGTETVAGSSDFIWILRLIGGRWQISRDVSFNHKKTSDK